VGNRVVVAMTPRQNAKSKGDSHDVHVVPRRSDRFYLGVFSFIDLVVPSVVLVAFIRIYALPVILFMWIVVGIRISRVRVEGNDREIRVFNRYRTISVETSQISRLQLRRLALGQGPFAVAVRRHSEGTLTRLRGGLVLEGTASYTGSVNASMAALNSLLRSHRGEV
jgi:hypothetical protein